MATFNTAFGSLPTPEKEFFGNGAAPRKGGAKGTGQIEQGTAPGATMNFADMQKAGYARPAPTAARPQRPQMLTSLGDQLKQPVAPLASQPQASTAPDVPPMLSALQTSLQQPTAAPMPAAAPPAAAGTAPAGGAPAETPPSEATTPTAGPAGMGTVETPVGTAPSYTAGTTPPPNAPNGSTFTAANGLVYTKRGGLWSYEGGDQDPKARGYGGLVPPELLGQTNTSAAGQGIQPTSLGTTGADYFLQKYGLPANDAEWATLAANAGMSVADLKNFTASNKWKYDTKENTTAYQEQMDPAGEAQAWLNDPANKDIRWEYKYVPRASRKEGDPPFRLKTEAELKAEGKWFQSSRAYDENGQLRTTISGEGGGPGGPGEGRPMLDEDQTYYPGGRGGSGAAGGGYGGGSGGGGYTTQQQGALPGYVSPKTTYAMPNYNTLLANLGVSLGTGGAPQAGGYTGSAQALELRKKLEAQLALLAAGSDTQKKAFDATRDARSAELTAQYGAERSKLEEDLAARGLSASTIGGGRYGDLAGQQARAMASFEADMLKQQSEAEARDRALYMTTMSDLAGMAGTQDLGTYEANIKAKQVQADIAFRAAELQQEAALKGRDLDLQQARDIATSQYQSGQLGLGYAEMRSREQMQREDQTFRAGESELERRIRLQLQGNDIRSQEEIARLDRGLRDKIASGELTLNQGIALGNISQRIYDGTLPIESWDTLLIGLGLDPKKFPRPPVNPNLDKKKDTSPTDTTGNPPRQENPPPADTLQNYTPGTRFNIRGVIYTLDASGRLIDPSGRQYNYSNAE